MMKIESDVLRAIIRERTHHTLETWIYKAIKEKNKVSPSSGMTVTRLIDVWKERGLPLDYPDIMWAEQLVSILKDLQQGKTPVLQLEPPKPFSKGELRTIEKAIFERRSLRSFTKDEIEPWIIDKIIEAGTWAPSACNLQTTRVLIVDDEEGLSIFRKGEVGGGTVYLVICQDYRFYNFLEHQMPDYNRNYDAGAFVQNLLLMAHALGLGAVWMTFWAGQADKIRVLYNLSNHMHISTYVALGWPSRGTVIPGRIKVDEVKIG